MKTVIIHRPACRNGALLEGRERETAQVRRTYTSIQIHTPGSKGEEWLQIATHSSILAWKIPWTEEPGRLKSLGSAKSRTTLSDFTFTFTFTFHGGSVVKNPPDNAGDSGSISRSGRSPGEGNGSPQSLYP